MTLKFEQFKNNDGVTLIEIVNPTITVNIDSIVVKPLLMQVGVDVLLETADGSKFGVHLPDVPVLNLEFQGEQNLLDTVTQHLNNTYAV